MSDLPSVLVVLIAFAPLALRHIAPETRDQSAVYHALAAGQIVASICLFAAMPLKEFLMFWAALPAVFGAWHFQTIARDRRDRRRRQGMRELAPGE
jgi:hypothetical protein